MPKRLWIIEETTRSPKPRKPRRAEIIYKIKRNAVIGFVLIGLGFAGAVALLGDEPRGGGPIAMMVSMFGIGLWPRGPY